MRDGSKEKNIEAKQINTQSKVKICAQNAAECIACALFDGNKSDWDLRCMNYFNSHQKMYHCNDIEKKDE